MALSRSALDVAAGALEHVLLLLARLVEQVGAHLFGERAAVGDQLLCLVARGVDLRLVLGEQLRGGLAVALRALDRVLERLFARFDGGRDRAERELARE